MADRSAKGHGISHRPQPSAGVPFLAPSPELCIAPGQSHALRSARRAEEISVPSQARGGGGFGTSGAQTRGARRQGAPEAGDRASRGGRRAGSRRGFRRAWGSLRPASRPRQPAAGASGQRPSQPPCGPPPAPRATRREPRQPPAHLLGAWPPAKERLDWRGGDKGRGLTGPAPSRLEYLSESAPRLHSKRSGAASRVECPATPARPGDFGCFGHHAALFPRQEVCLLAPEAQLQRAARLLPGCVVSCRRSAGTGEGCVGGALSEGALGTKSRDQKRGKASA